jgi:uncharacterized protein YceK
MNRKIVLIVLISCVLLSGCTSTESLGKGTLQITSSPSGAEVYLDNQFKGSTPSTISDVDMGNHTLEFRYPGYQSWSTVIAVSSGTSHYFAALTSQQNTSSAQGGTVPTTPPAEVTVRVNSAVMVIGDSEVFSGTCISCDKVLLTLYGPGYYAKGVSLEAQKINSADAWSYTWNPGYTIQSGGYTLIAEDAQKTTSDRVEFSVVGGGVVSISSNSYSAIRGDTLRLSGRCTSGAKTVLLVLYGPERYSGGVELGSASVSADDTWNLRYTLDSSMPTGLYTISVHDIPQTASSSIQFSVRAL